MRVIPLLRPTAGLEPGFGRPRGVRPHSEGPAEASQKSLPNLNKSLTLLPLSQLPRAATSQQRGKQPPNVALGAGRKGLQTLWCVSPIITVYAEHDGGFACYGQGIFFSFCRICGTFSKHATLFISFFCHCDHFSACIRPRMDEWIMEIPTRHFTIAQNFPRIFSKRRTEKKKKKKETKDKKKKMKTHV